LPQLLAKASELKLSERRAWRALLHWRGSSSEIDSSAFFLAKSGFASAEAELEASLSAFFTPPLKQETMPVFADSSDVDLSAADDGIMHAQCRYPARLMFLRRALKIDPERLPNQPCARLGQWFQTLDPGAIYLVYADAYLNNPSAAYGHTLMRIAKRSAPEHPLLSYVINYAATPDTNNAILYAIKGMMGFFPGNYSTMPYYLKVREYIDTESRDLWEYKLKLSPDEHLRLLLHLWELRGAWSRYYFFDENCSYHLMGLIEAARPSSELRKRFGAWVIPMDTVRALSSAGLIEGEPLWRPSRYQRLLAHKKHLQPGEAAQVPDLALGKAAGFTKRAPQRRAAMLDAAIEWFEYHHNPEDLDAEKSEQRQALMSRRSKAPATKPIKPQRPAAEPRQGHLAPRLILAAGQQGGRQHGFLSVVPSYHDHLDQPAGRSPDTRLQLGLLEARFNPQSQSFILDRLALVDLFSATPWTTWVPVKSWFLEAGYKRLLEEDERLAVAELASGWGLTLALGESRIYTMGEFIAQASPSLERNGRLAGGARLGLILRPSRRFRLTADARSRMYLGSDLLINRWNAAAAFDLGQQFQLRAKAAGWGELQSLHFGLALHY
jgi:hypothetical protein